MKQKLIFSLITALVLLSSCSKNGYVKLNYPQQPQAFLPEGTQSIAMINRSLTSEENKRGKTFEAITTGEVAGSDKLASDEALKGAIDAGQQLRDIQFVVPNPSRYVGTGTRETPDVLPWEVVEDICRTNNTDLLLVLETFDSNSDLVATSAVNSVGSILNGNIPRAPRVPGNVRMNIKSYWRLYDPSSRSIVDQFQHTGYMNFSPANGELPGNALPETAYFTGKEYVFRFLPTYYTVRRDLYKKTKGPDKRTFEAGFRRSEVANWQEAIDIWKPIAESGHRKAAGNACLNIAVAYEVLGDTNEALKWAQRSYQDFDDDLGRSYAKILLRRQAIERY